MPFVTVDNTRCFYRLEGDERNPALVLSHSLGCDHAMWQQQVDDLLPYFRILRYDTRGHGASDVTQGEYSVERLGRDVLAIADALGVPTFAFCGLSMGGAIGQWLAIHAPERLASLILANTSPRFKSDWQARITAVERGGMSAIADLAMQRFFSPQFAEINSERVSSFRSVLLGTDPVGYVGCCAALRDLDLSREVGRIKTRTLVIGGERDVSTPWDTNGGLLAKDIGGATAVRLDAAHLSNVERPRSFNAALFAFLKAADPDGGRSSDAGFAMRRKVLGNAHVDRAIAQSNEANRDFQDLITRYAWGAVWTRPGLDIRTRRLLVLAITASLGRWEEFRLHLSKGLQQDLEACDVTEVLLQVAIYAGVPAANSAFQFLSEELRRT